MMVGLSLVMVSLSTTVQAQRKVLRLPELAGYLTLKGDFHMHTVFSDGEVWPTLRVEEAWADGLDTIAITDHIESFAQRHKDYVSTDLNAAWKIIKDYAPLRDIIPIHAAEITRDMPPGHTNALFITDASLLKLDDPLAAIEAAHKQGAFLFFDHPGWKTQQPDGVPRWYDLHESMLKRGLLNGVEFSNGKEYYLPVLDWVRDKHLTVLGNTDIHGSVTDTHITGTVTHRPMTLVFAKERTEQGIKEAMFAGRTAVWFDEIVAGPEEIVTGLVKSALRVRKIYREDEQSALFDIENTTDIPVYLSGGPKGTPAKIKLTPHTLTWVRITKPVDMSDLTFTVDNFMCGESKRARITLDPATATTR
jgi:hypothetical protein